jgi:hypothetical protein
MPRIVIMGLATLPTAPIVLSISRPYRPLTGITLLSLLWEPLSGNALCHGGSQPCDRPMTRPGRQFQCGKNAPALTNISSCESLEKTSPPPVPASMSRGRCKQLLQRWSWTRGEGSGGARKPLTAASSGYLLQALRLAGQAWAFRPLNGTMTCGVVSGLQISVTHYELTRVTLRRDKLSRGTLTRPWSSVYACLGGPGLGSVLEHSPRFVSDSSTPSIRQERFIPDPFVSRYSQGPLEVSAHTRLASPLPQCERNISAVFSRP